MHRSDDMQLCKTGVSDLLLHKQLGNNSVHLATEPQYSVGKNAHDSGRAAAVDQFVLLLDQHCGQLTCSLCKHIAIA